jgi:hypothetical protein
MSLYADYIKEHRNDECIESDKGFCTYRYINDKQVYIVDVYIAPEHRKSKEAYKMADIIVEEAKQKGCTQLLGTVIPSAKNSTTSLKFLLGYGMSLDSSANDLIVFKKDII